MVGGMSSSSTSDETLVAVGDVHGHHELLGTLLREVGVPNDDGARRPGFTCVQVGDLLDLREDGYDQDLQTLKLARKWFDRIVIGNHELPYLSPIRVGFLGMIDDIAGTELGRMIEETMQEGRFVAACELGGWLVTHAGLDPTFLYGRGPLTDAAQKELREHAASAEQMAAHLNERFGERLVPRFLLDSDPLFDWVSMEGGGVAPLGSIFWCRWLELRKHTVSHQLPFGQIVGHTPPKDAIEPVCFMSRLWNVDLPGPQLAALVRAPGEQEWLPVTVRG